MNLVFNRWDVNGNPLPNLSELNNGGDTVSFPFFYNDTRFNIKNCRLDDITETDKFYFVITKIYSYTFFIKNGDIFLPKEIEDYIKNYNLKIIFLCEHESNKFVDTFMQLLIRKIRKNNWKEENFYIIDNNSMLTKLKERFNTKINVFKINYLIHFFSKNPNPPNINNIELDKKFIFLCQNRQPHYHRILFLAYLKRLNLLDNDITNWSLTMEHSEYMRYTQQSSNVVSLAHFKNYLDLNDKDLINDYKFICNTKQLCHYEENIDWSDTTNTYNYSDPTETFKGELNFQNSYINIVTESHYHHRECDVHITEKSFKPFYFFQLPLFVASWQHIKMMREEYDLHFFDDLIDHSYDDEKDDAKRFHMILNEVQRLSNMREEISTYYKSNMDKIIHNHNFIKNNKFDDIFRQYILNI
jgi:uncharacterized protein (UPF0248 family)